MRYSCWQTYPPKARALTGAPSCKILFASDQPDSVGFSLPINLYTVRFHHCVVLRAKPVHTLIFRNEQCTSIKNINFSMIYCMDIWLCNQFNISQKDSQQNVAPLG